jgi:hypothetical protein
VEDYILVSNNASVSARSTSYEPTMSYPPVRPRISRARSTRSWAEPTAIR